MLRWWLPENVATYGAGIDWMFLLIYWITGVTFVLVIGALLAFLWVYRDRPGRRARYTHGNSSLEIAWTVAPAAILVALTLLSVPMWSDIKLNIPQSDLVINVTGKQFNWEVTYPGPDGKFGTDDDKTLLDEMHVPINKVVRINLRGRDVIHSFFVPQFRFKQDAVPGRSIAQWFEVTKPGKYEAPCAELCGIGHSGMKAWVVAHTPEDYAKWAAENLKAAAPASQAVAAAIRANVKTEEQGKP
jgi:cytochrome c oxidase subunit II